MKPPPFQAGAGGGSRWRSRAFAQPHEDAFEWTQGKPLPFRGGVVRPRPPHATGLTTVSTLGEPPAKGTARTSMRATWPSPSGVAETSTR